VVTKDEIQALRETVAVMARKGLRVLLVGALQYNGATPELEQADPKQCTIVLYALMGIQDPLRAGVPEIIAATQTAGIRTIMITGDHRATALAIAREAGLVTGDANVLDGSELGQLSQQEWADRLDQINVYARVTPEDKLNIIRMWQKRGEVVAMTGDGVNDAPALKLANIGIALGSGTDVAKQASDIVLLDDNYRTIIAAIEQGRIIFDNLRKIVLFLMATSFTSTIAIVISLFFGLPAALTASQVLWINLVTETMPYLALTLEDTEEGVMGEKPVAATVSILDRQMRFFIIVISGLSGLATAGIYALVSIDASVDHARSVAFTAVAVTSLLYIFSCRQIRKPIWRYNPFGNIWMVAAVLAGLALQFAVLYIPFLQKTFSTAPLMLSEWGLVVGMAVMVVGALEAIKVYHQRQRNV
jgi:Ca2+-transporting ATPase